MGLWKGRKHTPAAPGPVQLRPAQRHPFQMIDGYVPLHQPDFSLYRAIREAVPVVDAAMLKLVRLAGGVEAVCEDKGGEEALNQFLRTVPAGWNQRGIQSFLDSYLDCLLTCGRAVGEIVPSRDGREIAAVLCGSVSHVEVKAGDSPLDQKLALRRPNGEVQVLPRQDLLLFTPYHPSPEHPYGQSLLHGMPFLSGVLLKIYQTLGENWERAGNVRFAVVYKPEEGLDQGRVQERGKLLAQRWSQAVEHTRSGSVRDFVAVGDVEIKVIGAECQIPDCQAVVVCDSEDLSVQQSLRDQVAADAQNRRERIAVVPGGRDESVSQLVTRAQGLNSERVVLTAPGVSPEEGGALTAAAVAGAICGQADPALPLGGQVLTGVSALAGRYTEEELDTLLQGGVTPLEMAAGQCTVIRGVTTRTKTGDAPDDTWRELGTILVVDDVIPAIRDALRARFPRAKNTAQTRGAIRSQVILELERKLAAEIITGYGEVTTETPADRPTVCLVTFSFAVAQGLNQIWLSVQITV